MNARDNILSMEMVIKKNHGAYFPPLRFAFFATYVGPISTASSNTTENQLTPPNKLWIIEQPPLSFFTARVHEASPNKTHLLMRAGAKSG